MNRKNIHVASAMLLVLAVIFIASSFAFFFYVPVIAIGGAWIFGVSMLLATAVGIWIGSTTIRPHGTRLVVLIDNMRNREADLSKKTDGYLVTR